MANQELSCCDGGPSQLKIVLLGGRNSGKSCVGNAILGREEFATRERTTCSRQQGLAAGRRVSVVDTPGWWCDFGTRDTAQLVKTEIAGSVLLCSPGPHVFLVVVKACSLFSEQRRSALEQHVTLLGEAVWRHCVVVLTCADGRAHRTAECSARTENSALRWLTEKCSGRCQRLALSGGTVGSQVLQLFAKIQRLEAENANRPFEVEPSCLRSIQQSMETVEGRALQRFLRMKERRAQMQVEARPLSDLRVVVVGPTGSGKTSVIHAILGGDGGARCQASGRTARCQVHRGHAFDRDVTVVDTPGWWMNYYAAESSAFDRRELARGARLCVPGPHAVLLVLRADRAFSDGHRRAAQEHLELLLGPGVWGRTLLVFSCGDWLCDASVERFVESEGGPLGWLVDRCGDRYHVMSNARTAGGGRGSGAAELLAKVEEMVAANGGCARLRAEGGGADPEEQRRGAEERAGRRLLEMTEQRRALRSQLERLSSLPEVTLVLLGGRNSGRTSCGDTILGRAGLHADNRTSSCSERRAQVRGVSVTVLAPPHSPADPDLPVTPREVTSGLSALLLVVNVSAAFTSSLLEALEKQMLLAGGGEEEEEQAMRWSRAMVLFSHGDWLGDSSMEERIEGEGAALRSLVDRCGNRYHVLDNRTRAGPDQVHQLLDRVQEMLAGARLALLQRGDPIRGSVTPSGGHRERGLETFKPPNETQGVRSSCTKIPEPLACPGDAGLGCLVVPRRGRPRSVLKVYIDMTNLTPHAAASSPSPGLAGRPLLRWTVVDVMTALGISPNRRSTVPPHARLEEPREGGVCTFSPRHQESRLASPDVMATRSCWAPGDDTLRKLFADGDLQALIDQWRSSSLEELEAFVDTHFEMAWERAMASPPADDVTEPGGTTEEAEQSTLSSIEKKLSKLHLLEDIQRDLTEVKHSLEKCWKVMQELMEAHKPHQHHAEEDSQNVTHE